MDSASEERVTTGPAAVKASRTHLRKDIALQLALRVIVVDLSLATLLCVLTVLLALILVLLPIGILWEVGKYLFRRIVKKIRSGYLNHYTSQFVSLAREMQADPQGRPAALKMTQQFPPLFLRTLFFKRVNSFITEATKKGDNDSAFVLAWLNFEVSRRPRAPGESKAALQTLVRCEPADQSLHERWEDAWKGVIDTELDANPDLWGEAALTLGDVFLARYPKDPKGLEQALTFYADARKVFKEKNLTVEWARTLNRLTEAHLKVGGHTKNKDELECAIQCDEMSLEVWRLHDGAPEWAETNRRLGFQYRTRAVGERRSNTEKAIGYYQTALTAFDFGSKGYAEAQYGLACAYLQRTQGDRASNLAMATECLVSARASGALSANLRKLAEDALRQALVGIWGPIVNTLASDEHRQQATGFLESIKTTSLEALIDRSSEDAKVVESGNVLQRRISLLVSVACIAVTIYCWHQPLVWVGAWFVSQFVFLRTQLSNRENPAAYVKEGLVLVPVVVRFFLREWRSGGKILTALLLRALSRVSAGLRDLVASHLSSVNKVRDRYVWAILAGAYSSLAVSQPRGDLGEAIEEAIQYLEESTEIFEELGYSLHASRSKELLASLYTKRIRGSKQQNARRALQLLTDESLQFPPGFQRRGDAKKVARRKAWLRTLGDVYCRQPTDNRQEDLSRAVGYYVDALKLTPVWSWGGRYRTSLFHDRAAEKENVYLLKSLGQAFVELTSGGTADRLQLAIESFKQALASLDKDPGASATKTIGYSALTQTRQRYELTLLIAKAARSSISSEDVQSAEGIESLLRVTASDALKIGLPETAREALLQLGEILYAQCRYAEAGEAYRGVVSYVDQIRAGVLSLDRRAELLRETALAYDRLVCSLVREKRIAEALEFAERGKSRTLADLLSLRDLFPKAAPPALTSEYRQALLHVRNLEETLRNNPLFESLEGSIWAGQEAQKLETPEQNLFEMRRSLRKETRELKDLEDQIKGYDPDFLAYATSASHQEITQVAKKLDAVLVLGRVTDDGTFFFLAFPGGQVDVIEMTQFTRSTLDHFLFDEKVGPDSGGWVTCQQSFEQSRRRAAGDGWLAGQALDGLQRRMESQLGELYDRLVCKVHDRLLQATSGGKVGRRIVLVPNRGLAILPLHACWWREADRRRYFIDDFDVSYAPSFSVLKRCIDRNQGTEREGAWLGVPDQRLAFSSWECRRIAEIIGPARCTTLTQEGGRCRQFLNLAPQYSLTHLSCHAQYRLDAPFKSSLTFGYQDDLTLADIFEQLDVRRGWLSVLAACETGLVDPKDLADEHVGLSMGLLTAGAATVWSTLWVVDSPATALTVSKAYENLFSHGLDKSEALRRAQLWLRDATYADVFRFIEDGRGNLTSRENETDDAIRWDDFIQEKDTVEGGPFVHPYFWAGLQSVGA